jgi:hypothetical protein
MTGKPCRLITTKKRLEYRALRLAALRCKDATQARTVKAKAWNRDLEILTPYLSNPYSAAGRLKRRERF